MINTVQKFSQKEKKLQQEETHTQSEIRFEALLWE